MVDQGNNGANRAGNVRIFNFQYPLSDLCNYINALLWPVYTITSLLYCSHSVCFASESHVDCCMVLISNNGITEKLALV